MQIKEFIKDNYFKIDVEAHLIGDISQLDYYPAIERAKHATGAMYRAFGFRKMPGDELSDKPNDERDLLIYCMDRYGVDIACVLPEAFMESTGNATRWSTNGYVASFCGRYPKRLIFTANVGPIIKRGVKNAIWELEYLVKERNCRMVKFYPPDDTYINDRELWPFYAKISELRIPVAIHTGAAWTPPGLSKYCQPNLLEEVTNDFPDLKIIAYHLGWPNYTDLNVIGLKSPNLYVSMSLLVPWCITAPLRAAHYIGEALQFLGPDRIIWGTDYALSPRLMRYSVEGFRNFQIPEDFREKYGYPVITEEDRRKIFGSNLAKLFHIEPTKLA